jgi:hypothetical protein
MTHTIRVRLNDDLFRKYKAFCAIDDISMTQQTQKIVSEFIRLQNEKIKIIKT